MNKGEDKKMGKYLTTLRETPFLKGLLTPGTILLYINDISSDLFFDLKRVKIYLYLSKGKNR